MPIYQYECLNGHREEYLEAFDSATTFRCELCGGVSLRIISAPSRAVIKKGCSGAQRRG